MTDQASLLEGVDPDQQQFILSAAKRLSEEFTGIFGPETITRFLKESLSDLQRARIRSFVPLFAERFARERLWSLAKVEGKIQSDKPTVLFVCVQNAGRSQMAAGWLRHLAGDRVTVLSGGSAPGQEIHANAAAAMEEVGIDIRQQFPKPWTDETVRAADVVITMGCGDACPIFPGKRYEDWQVDDPAHADVETVRRIRDDIRARVEKLLAELGIPVAPH